MIRIIGIDPGLRNTGWGIIGQEGSRLTYVADGALHSDGDKPLAEVAKDRDGLEAIAIGPFSWLTRGTAPFGSQPVLSQPDGVAMPGEEFMQAMFALEPGRSGVAFNEPQTVCYCIRLSAFDPDDAVLKERFVAASSDPRRLAAVAGQDMRDVFVRWMQELETRKRVSWKRPPRLGD